MANVERVEPSNAGGENRLVFTPLENVVYSYSSDRRSVIIESTDDRLPQVDPQLLAQVNGYMQYSMEHREDIARQVSNIIQRNSDR